MIKVFEKFKVNNKVLLICDKFDIDKATDTLTTKIGVFLKNQFEIQLPKPCFSNPSTIGIFINTTKDCSDVNEIEFK